MKLKIKAALPETGLLPSGEEEFFQLPRAEFLVDEMQNTNLRHIGDLVANSPRRLSHRFTMKIDTNDMKGADIRADDYVVVEEQTIYPEGCILAVQLGNRQLIRRYSRARGRIHLLCDPPSGQIIIVEEHIPDFRILGQVVQVIREIR